jgi:HK97 family phage prohead protease
MEQDELIQQILARPHALGIRSAREYVTSGGLYEASRLECAALGLCKPIDIEDAVKEASRTLVYHDDDMLFLKQVPQAERSALSCMDFVAVITSTRKDRDGDVLESGGASVDPRSPLLWQHMPQFPIGKLVKVLSQDKQLVKGTLSIADTQQGRDSALLVEFGALRISHGFKPKSFQPLRPEPGDMYPGIHVLEFDVFEVSLVSVPSNEDAVITAFSRQKLHDPLFRAWAGAKFALRAAVVKGGYDPVTGGQLATKGAVPYKQTPAADADRPWDAAAATERLAKWASSDGSGDKAKIDWEKYQQGFAWVDSDAKDAFGSYKLPHHDIDDGKLVVVKAGVSAAVGALNGSRGSSADIPEKDRRSCWQHLARHLKDEFGYKPDEIPKLKSFEDMDGQDPVRWNRSLSKAFDVASEILPPSSTLVAWVSDYLEVPIKHVFETTVPVPSVRMGSFLTGLREAMASFKVEDVRNISFSGTESPPRYEKVELNSTKSDTFLVSGTAFCRGPQGSLVLDVNASYFGVSLTFFAADNNRHVIEDLVEAARKWAEQNNFLKGESFALSGEFLPKTGEDWGDLFLEPENEQAVRRVIDRLNAKQLGFANHGMLLCGPPGTGKTLACRLMMNKANATFIWVSARDLYHSGAFGGISMGFDLAKELAPSVLVLEDIDNWLNDYTIDMMKTEMDGIGRSSGCLTVLTTNFPERLPAALIDRPGRFHDVLEFQLPDKTIRTAMLQKWLPGASPAKIEDAATRTEGMAGAHLYHLAAFARAIQESDGIVQADAIDRAIQKTAEQRDLIDGIQLQGSRYRPHRAAGSLFPNGEKGMANIIDLWKKKQASLQDDLHGKSKCGCGKAKSTKAATAHRMTRTRVRLLKKALGHAQSAHDHEEMAETCKPLVKAAMSYLVMAMPPMDDDDDSDLEPDGSDLEPNDSETEPDDSKIDDGDEGKFTSAHTKDARLTEDRMKCMAKAQGLLMDAHDHEEMTKAENARMHLKSAHEALEAIKPETAAGDGTAPTASIAPQAGHHKPGSEIGKSVEVNATRLLADVIARRASWSVLHDVKRVVDEEIARQEADEDELLIT